MTAAICPGNCENRFSKDPRSLKSKTVVCLEASNDTPLDTGVVPMNQSSNEKNGCCLGMYTIGRPV